MSKASLLRLGAKLTLRLCPQLSIGNTVILSRWQDIHNVLNRDLDFAIEPINQKRIERVNGPFILGLDRSKRHQRERDALYQAMRLIDLNAIESNTQIQANACLDKISNGQSINIVNQYARPIASLNATLLTGIQGPDNDSQMQVARALFHELFLNLGEDKSVQKKAIEQSAFLKEWCLDIISKQREMAATKDDMIGRLVLANVLDDDAIRRTVSGMFVGAIDTTATCVAQIIWTLVNHRHWHRQVKRDLDAPEKMRKWCWEALRFWPHNPIILRQATRDTEVGNKRIKKGQTIACFTLAGMHDPSVFSRPNRIQLDRAEQHYLHFGAGLHPCAGRAINGIQIPQLVTQLLRRNPMIQGAIDFDGPFPDRLMVTLQS